MSFPAFSLSSTWGSLACLGATAGWSGKGGTVLNNRPVLICIATLITASALPTHLPFRTGSFLQRSMFCNVPTSPHRLTTAANHPFLSIINYLFIISYTAIEK